MKLFRTACLLSSLLILTGCGTVGPGGGEPVSEADHVLARDVHQRLQASSIPHAAVVGVLAENGVVTLYGSVDDPAHRLQLESIAAQTPGVTQVQSRFTR